MVPKGVDLQEWLKNNQIRQPGEEVKANPEEKKTKLAEEEKKIIEKVEQNE